MVTATFASGSRFRALCLLSGFALFAVGCGSSVREIEPSQADAKGVTHRQFRVECIELDQCKKKASTACGSTYSVVSEWHNTIPESDLPGLNEGSRPKDSRDWNRLTLTNETGIESKDPMPLTSLVVACNG
jgi:hypothetical protein